MLFKNVLIKQLDEVYGTQNLEKEKLFFLKNQDVYVLSMLFRNEGT